MKLRNTLILFATAAVLVIFIAVFERHGKTTEDAHELERRAFPEFKGRDDEADAIEIVRGAEKIVIVRRDVGTSDEHWRITQPIDYPADTSRVIGFLGAFESAEKSVIGPGGELEKPLGPADSVADPGLDSESAVRVIVSSGRERLLDALVGNLTPTKDKVYVARYSREAVYAVGDEVLDEARRIVDEFRDKRLVRLKTRGKVTGIVILQDDKPRAELSREKGGRWHLVSPVADRADESRARAIIDRMASLWVDRFVVDFEPDDPERPKRMAEYGLLPAKRSVKITLDVGGDIRQHEVLFGGRVVKTETGVGKSYDCYAMVSGSHTVALIAEQSLEPVEVAVDDLRDRKVVDLDAQEAVSVSVSSGPGGLRLERSGRGEWRVVNLIGAPERQAAEGPRVRRLLDALADLRIERFLPAGTRLETPIRVEAVLESDAPEGERGGAGRRRKEIVLFEPGEGDSIRGVRGEDGTAFEVPSSILAELRARPIEFWRRRVLGFDARKLVRLSVTLGGRTERATREDGEWRLAGGGEVDKLRADRIKWELSELEAEGFVGKAGEEELKGYGLDPPAIRVEVGLESEAGGAERTFVLLVGAVRPSVDGHGPGSGEEGERHYAKLEGDAVVFLHGERLVKDLRMGLARNPDAAQPAGPDQRAERTVRGPGEGGGSRRRRNRRTKATGIYRMDGMRSDNGNQTGIYRMRKDFGELSRAANILSILCIPVICRSGLPYPVSPVHPC